MVVDLGSRASVEGGRVRAGPDAVPVDAAARAAAERYLRALGPGVPVSLWVQGTSDSAPCAPPQELSAPPGSPVPFVLADQLATLEPGPPGSLAWALHMVENALRDAPSAEATTARLVLVGGGSSACGGDPCAAAERLIARGVEIDVVDVGGGGVAACLASPEADAGSALARAVAPAPAQVAFRVERRAGREGSGGGVVTAARGRAGDDPLALPSGPIRIVVELDPPEVVGPLVLTPGVLTRVRVLDFPRADAGGRRRVFVDAIAPDVRAAPREGWE
jgi:hypothetical protein